MREQLLCTLHYAYSHNGSHKGLLLHVGEGVQDVNRTAGQIRAN